MAQIQNTISAFSIIKVITSKVEGSSKLYFTNGVSNITDILFFYQFSCRLLQVNGKTRHLQIIIHNLHSFVLFLYIRKSIILASLMPGCSVWSLMIIHNLHPFVLFLDIRKSIILASKVFSGFPFTMASLVNWYQQKKSTVFD